MDLTVSWTSWLLAFVPLAGLLIFMLWWRWGAAEAGPVAWIVAVIVGWTYFEMPAEAIGYETAKGAWSALTVLYVVWASILVYEVTHEANAFEPLRRGITKVLPHPLMQVLAFGWAFASFLQGVTGFGVPIAVCAPLLVGIGVRPLYAVVIPLIGHAWNNTFGTLAVAWFGLKEVTAMGPALAAETALYAAAFIWVLNLLGGFLVCWLYGRFDGIRKGLPVILVMSAIQGGLTLALSQWNDTLNGFIASSVAFVAIFVLARLPRYREGAPFDSKVFMDGLDDKRAGEATGSGGRAGSGGGATSGASGPAVQPLEPVGANQSGGAPATVGTAVAAPREMSVNAAFIPYYALLAITFGILLVPPLKDSLSLFTIDVSFPGGSTGLGWVTEDSIGSMALFTHAGTFLLLAAVVGYVAFRAMGCMATGSVGRVLGRTVDKSIPSTIAVIALIAMANVMSGAGMVQVLAEGVAQVTGGTYGLLAPLVGGLGAFMTTSNLASNLLFGDFQQSTAQATGLKTSAILGAQTAGGAAGNMIAPGNVLLGTTTAGILGREGDVLRITIPLFVMVSVIIGLSVFLVA